jgi:hypothetical protein
VLFGCRAPLIRTLTVSGSALSIAGLLGREHLGDRGLFSAGLTLAGAAVISQGSLSGAHGAGSALIALATLAWGIDNTISQRLSLRNPIQIAPSPFMGHSSACPFGGNRSCRRRYNSSSRRTPGPAWLSRFGRRSPQQRCRSTAPLPQER